MACDAWDDVTIKTIKNCWDHADIQCNPIILCILLTLIQKGWNIIKTFASSGMTLPQAEDSLKQIFGDQYNDDYWQPALKVVTETEPDEDIHLLIKALQQKSDLKKQPFTPTKYTEVAAEVASTIKELGQRKQIFDGTPSADVYIELEIEREVEVVPVHTDDELVMEVLTEQAIEKGEIVEKEDDVCDEEEELEMTKEILSSVIKLQWAFLLWGDVCVSAAKMLALVQDEVGWEEI